jgi:hypothetical protein
MMRKKIMLGRVALGALATLPLSAGADAKPRSATHHAAKAAEAAPGPDVQAQLKALQDQVAALVAWRNAQAEEKAHLDQQVSDLRGRLSAAEAHAEALQAAADEQIKTIPGVVKSEVAAEQPKDGKLHYRGVTLTLGGFAAAESVFRSKDELADIGSSFSKIPFANSPLYHTQEVRGTARQSRLSLLTEGDIDPDTHAAFYTELDFLAGPQTANSNESNSFSPRIRNVYGALDVDNYGLHLLAGQNWSLATLNSKGISPRNELPPPTIDAQYVVGFSWTRQPQFRVTKDFADRQIWAAVSVENPQTTFASAATGVSGTAVSGLTVTVNGAPTSQFDSANTLSLNHRPDVIGKVAFEPNLFGSKPVHLEAYGLYRSFYDRVNVTSANNPLGLPVLASNRSTDGGGFGWGATWAAWPGRLDLETSGLTGRGVGRYGSGQLPDAVVGPDGALKPIPETMFMGGGTLHVTHALDLYVFGGTEREKAVYSAIGPGTYGFGAPTATLAGCDVEGGACSPNIHLMTQITGGLWDKIYQGKFGSVRVGLQYSHTELTAFAGMTGGQPRTTDDMIFTSFRYYPF